MKVFLVLSFISCFWLTMSLIVLADDDLNSSNDLNNKKFDDPGPARSLPRSERKRLRLLKLQNEHKIKKRDISDDDNDEVDSSLSISTTTKTPSLNLRGNIKASDTIHNDYSLKGDNDFLEGTKNFQFAYNLDDHNRNEILHVVRTPKELSQDTIKNNEDETDTVEAKGSFSFVSADGFKYTTKYIADNKGFRPIVLVEKI
ncbi:uncharacterized protein LOC129610364 [Condylostylus longicornis]|uniref:uncharacterized protein LOC129610364 n=1 Tax=Condylostylus longicornis TaxID=2530218 RepID=UPI00244DEE11|nr:uncharacterized protein LOC129610364 [Condylostylus longicornis]